MLGMVISAPGYGSNLAMLFAWPGVLTPSLMATATGLLADKDPAVVRLKEGTRHPAIDTNPRRIDFYHDRWRLCSEWVAEAKRIPMPLAKSGVCKPQVFRFDPRTRAFRGAPLDVN